MHESSYLNMRNFMTKYLDPSEKLIIVDVGSQAVGGDPRSYRNLCSSAQWRYIGCDAARGDNVDVLLESAYSWKSLASGSADVVISGQAFEHIEFPWATMSEISRILKDSGLCCIIAPSNGVRHCHPVDCWRFYEDGMRALAKYADMEVLEVFTQRSRLDFADYDSMWQDTVCVCRKPKRNFARKLVMKIRQAMNRYLVHDLDPAESPPENISAQLFFHIDGKYSEENSLVTCHYLENSRYSAAFDLLEFKKFKLPRMREIRFDPAAKPIEFFLEEAKAVCADGEIYDLKVAGHNGEADAESGAFVFKHCDPIIIFDSSLVDFSKIDHIRFLGSCGKLRHSAKTCPPLRA